MDRTAIVTGASSGIGAEVARELARRSWRVAVVGRNPERTEAVAKSINATAFVCDFDSLDNVRNLAEELTQRFDRIDAVVNNAGGIVAKRQESIDSHELTLQRNVLGSVVLTERIVPKLLHTRGRVIHTSSMVSRLGKIELDDLGFSDRRFGAGWWPYASAKLGVILYARSLAMRTGLESYPVHPGYVRSGFGAESRSGKAILSLTGWLQIIPAAGAAPRVHPVSPPELDAHNGHCFPVFTPHGPTPPVAAHPHALTAHSRRLPRARTPSAGLLHPT